MYPKRVGAWFALCITILAAMPAAAAEKAVNISLFPPIALAKPEDAVTAFRLNLIYGKNTATKIVDLGLVNHTTTGVASGLQWGAINITEGQLSGIQLAALNLDKGTTKGLQFGGINYAKTGGGLQLALINYAEEMNGLQIGAINIIKKGGFLPVMVIANWGKSKK
jgi:hypothetical protein